MKASYNIYDIGISVLGVSVGIETIYTTLGIILLILSIANILIKAAFKIYDVIKEKKYREIPDILDDTIEELKEVDKNE